ncbi:MAG: ABC transporter substrate-binding protein [Lachnospiraceae bacterium]|jgi:branched-chain amino acid transport system substrate-binding protein|nr:ABC transporter substrate-binding protein [Lachnospiraceae bacterium]
MKRFTSLFLVLAMAVSIFAGCGGSADEKKETNAPEETTAAAKEEQDTNAESGAAEESGGAQAAGGDTVTFGLSCAITGNFPLAGERTLQGVQMAVDEINAAGGVLGKKLEFVYEDDGNDPTQAVTVVTKLLNEDICGMIGPHTTTNCLAVQELVGETKIPYITGGSGIKIAAAENPWVFQCRPSDGMNGIVAADFAVKELGAKKVGVFFNNNDFGVGGRDAVTAELDKLEVEYITLGHNSGDTDMTSQLMQFISEGIDTMILWTDDAEDVVVARQAYELGLEANVITSAGVVMEQVLSQMEPEYVEGWYSVTDFVPANEDPVVSKFVEDFKALYDIEPELYASAYYGAVKFLAAAIEKAGSDDPAAIRDAMAELKDVNGPTGTLSCASDNTLIHSCVVTQITDLKPAVVNTVTADFE